MTETLAQIDAPHFCAGIVLWDDKVVEAADIVKYMRKWSRDRVRDYCNGKMNDILDDLRDLHTQATTERSHYYVAGCAMRAIVEIQHLRRDLAGAVTLLGEKLKDSQMARRRATITQADRSS